MRATCTFILISLTVISNASAIERMPVSDRETLCSLEFGKFKDNAYVGSTPMEDACRTEHWESRVRICKYSYNSPEIVNACVATFDAITLRIKKAHVASQISFQPVLADAKADEENLNRLGRTLANPSDARHFYREWVQRGTPDRDRQIVGTYMNAMNHLSEMLPMTVDESMSLVRIMKIHNELMFIYEIGDEFITIEGFREALEDDASKRRNDLCTSPRTALPIMSGLIHVARYVKASGGFLLEKRADPQLCNYK